MAKQLQVAMLEFTIHAQAFGPQKYSVICLEMKIASSPLITR